MVIHRNAPAAADTSLPTRAAPGIAKGNAGERFGIQRCLKATAVQKDSSPRAHRLELDISRAHSGRFVGPKVFKSAVEEQGWADLGCGYSGLVSSQRVPGGVVHKLPMDLREALIANATALAAWKDITPLARNEFICWVEDAKQETTRKRRIRRTQEELEEGQRRPCCWPGCKHRERAGR